MFVMCKKSINEKKKNPKDFKEQTASHKSYSIKWNNRYLSDLLLLMAPHFWQ